MSDAHSLLRRDLESFLHDHIPLTRAMGVHVAALDPLTLEAPVARNSNHLRTAFGGSINALATLAAYGLLWLELREHNSLHVIVAESSIRFLRPVRENIRAICPRPSGIDDFRRMVVAEKRARISLAASVEENGAIAAEFHGLFVARSA